MANYSGSLVNAAVPLITLPFLLHALGPTMWGLVSFATLITTIMALLNAGMAQSMVREFGSRWFADCDGRNAAARLLYAYERIYWCGALVIALCVAPFSGLIVSRWLNVGAIPHDVAIGAVHCAIVLFVVQLPSAIYKTALTALQAQVWQNGAQASFTLIKGVGGVIVVNQTHSVLTYLYFLIFAVLLETLTMAHGAWRLMPQSRSRLFWDAAEVKRSLRFSTMMSLLVILGVLTTQVDKFYVSLKLPIEQLGIYSIAYTLAMGVLQVGYPLFTAVLPRLVEIGADSAVRRRANAKLVKLIGAIILLVGVVYVVASRRLLEFWLGDAVMAAKVAVVLDWLMLSSALNTLYNIGYVNWVSQGEVRWLSAINLVAFLLALFVTPVAIDTFGLPGAAFSPVAINLIGSAATTVWLAHGTGSQESLPR
jgi:O-antigen/teichoic acid export membrane protein